MKYSDQKTYFETQKVINLVLLHIYTYMYIYASTRMHINICIAAQKKQTKKTKTKVNSIIIKKKYFYVIACYLFNL